MGALVIAMKPALKASKGSPGAEAMGGPDDAEEEEEVADDGSEFDAALDDFLKASKEGDDSTAKEALSAAIAAKVSALLAEKE
jgi:hypothetical protein